MSSRRALLAAPLLAPLMALGACGFRPLYGPNGEGGTGAAVAANEPNLAEALASVRVGLIPERNGQLMRRALQRQLEGSRPGVQSRYDLEVTLVYATEVLGYQTDGLATRVRVVASANWVLATQSVPREVVDRGSARTVDAYNLPNLQFFASDASREDMERRLVAELSQRVTVGVAVALRRRMASAATS
ncbi:LPS assembly lipoprotein LptE [Sediminicoccus rosea]|uniref:LPS assembly lipoprotein LptE n=1 Tax=Sediminicoccus rosea TaxID=1225128 RepID=A0ABZ0PKH6_9PROT|nr:LPS assembly lipoprotein LptE [Sediminicoccus rosea]WPB86250.1 LPS assembly lipoprotein LptE [Sediminicoccus rosea]